MPEGTSRKRAAVRRLRSGVVPSWEFAQLSVGYDAVSASVAPPLAAIIAGRHPSPLFVRGEWGTGKSHLLSFVRASADAQGIPSVKVDLNARFSALNYPQRFYRTIAEGLRLTDCCGLQDVLLTLLNDPVKRARLGLFARSEAAGHLGRQLTNLVSRGERGEHLDLSDDPVWFMLSGGDLAWADYQYKRKAALERVRFLGSLFAAVGLGGLVLVFDEAETIDQLWNIRSRLTAYQVLGQLCQLSSVWCVFAITQRFDRVIKHDAEHNAAALEGASRECSWFIRSWARSELPSVTPPLLDRLAAQELASAVIHLYRGAYPNATVEDLIVRRCIEEWAVNPTQNPRRLIRLLVHRLDAARPLLAISGAS